MVPKFMLSCYKRGKIPQSVRDRLESYSLINRCGIVSCTYKDRALFFIACEKGNVETMEYLLRECDANIDQRGLCEMFSEAHYAAPLSKASAAGNYDMVKFLVEHGADVNSRSDVGQTPVWYACFWKHYEIVVYLVSHGANIQIPDNIGKTCLMISVQSLPLCKFLLSKGANINNARDQLLRTALHFAIENKCFETSKLLLENGSNPYIKNFHRDDALQTACLNCQTDIFEYLIENYRYSRERIAEAYDLMGANILKKEYNVCLARQFWSTAFNMMPKLFPHLHRTEFTTLEELNNMNLEQLNRHSSFIFTRILIPRHPYIRLSVPIEDEIIRERAQNQYCLDLLKDDFELVIQKETLLHSEVCFVIQRLANMFLCLSECQILFEGITNFENTLNLTTLMFNHLPEAINMIRTRPLHFPHLENFDKVFIVMLQLLYALCRLDKTQEQVNQVDNITNQVLKSDFKDSNGNSLLHLVVSGSHFNKNLNFCNVKCYSQIVFTKLLLECGADVDCVNSNLKSPLNLASRPELIELLLNYGAHPDRRCDTGIPNIPDPFDHTTLKCLAARTIVEKQVKYRGKVPASIEEFIKIH